LVAAVVAAVGAGVSIDTQSELVMTSDGKGCHKSWLQQWLQQLEPDSSEILRVAAAIVSCEVYTL
jgi:hypothetical protein